MPPGDAARKTDRLADTSAALGRVGRLVEIVAASVAGVSTAPSAMGVLPEILASLARVVRFDRVVLVETPPQSSRESEPAVLFHWTAAHGAATPPSAEERASSPEIAAALHEWRRPLLQGQPIVTLRSRAAEPVRRLLSAVGVMTSLMLPIVVEGRQWGRIGFDDCGSEHDWAEDEIQLLSMLAQVIGAAITRERFRQQAQQREQLLQAVTNCAAQIGTASDLRQAITTSLNILARAVDADRMLLMEAFADSGDASVPRMLLRNFWHGPDTPLRLDQIAASSSVAPDPDVAAWMAPLQRGVAVEGQLASAQGGVRQLFQRLQARSVLLVPIMVDARYWGHIGLDMCRHERVWSGAEVDVLRILADLIGTAITRERYLAELARADTIIQSSPTILYRLRAEPSLPMIYVSKNIARLGHEPAQLLSAPTLYRNLIHPEDRELVRAAMQRLLRAGLEHRVSHAQQGRRRAMVRELLHAGARRGRTAA
jgi:GAF domain-containing protein